MKPKNKKARITPAEFTFIESENYDLHHINLDNDIGRGMILLTDKRLAAKEVKINNEFEENLFVEIKLNNSDLLLVGIIYRSESGTPENNELLLKTLDNVNSNKYSHALIMGDFNLPNINWKTPHFGKHNKYDQEFLDCIQNNDLFQFIDHPTRCRGLDTPHVLDLVLSNDLNISDIEYQSPLGKSDHSVMVFKYHCYAELHEKEITKLLYDKTDYEGLNNEIREIHWQSWLIGDNADINSIWNKFHCKIKELERKYVPLIKIKNNKKFNPFPLDEKAKGLIKKKHILSRAVINENNDENRRAYNKIRNKVKGAMNKLRKDFEKKLGQGS